jgi:hypothetical protein
LTRAGTCIPSYDSEGNWDIVKIDVARLGGFIQVSIGFEGDSWSVHTHATQSVKAKFLQQLKDSCAPEGLTEVEQLRAYDGRFDVWVERIKLGIAASLAAIIHDLWLADRCAPRFLEKATFGKPETIDAATDWPALKYITRIDQLSRSGQLHG